MKRLTFILVFVFFELIASDKSIVVVVPSYNNKSYYKANLQSILTQNYDNFRIIYLNDCSTDGMGKLIEGYLLEKNVDFVSIVLEDLSFESLFEKNCKFSDQMKGKKPFFTLVHNTKRAGALANIFRAIHSLEDSDVVVLIDGDDMLSDVFVLERVNSAYDSKDQVWLTHGTLKEYPAGRIKWSQSIPEKIINSNTFRKFRCPSHLRTFYSWLFKKIKFEDLLYEGDFFQMTWDMAIMYPMIEMAGSRHQFLTEVNYVYNIGNNINDNKVNPQLQNDLDQLIRGMPVYLPLNPIEIPSFMESYK